ncbi:MAG: hypothetical protein ACRCXZ_04225 [Patescibacteria group bacterium]
MKKIKDSISEFLQSAKTENSKLKIIRKLNAFIFGAFVLFSIFNAIFVDCGMKTVIVNCSNQASVWISGFLAYLVSLLVINIIWIVLLFLDKDKVSSAFQLKLKCTNLIILIVNTILGLLYSITFASLLAGILSIVFAFVLVFDFVLQTICFFQNKIKKEL